jgi:hypothetical protein
MLGLLSMINANRDGERRFAATQRTAVYLGLPNGNIAEFDNNNQIVLHFRNYGQSTAENTLPEAWPLIAVLNKPTAVFDIPPFQGFPPIVGPSLRGISIPPGFPKAKLVPIRVEDCELIEANKATLAVMGRISYIDSFGKYCQPFVILYIGGSVCFDLSANPSNAMCGKKWQRATGNMAGARPSIQNKCRSNESSQR